MMNETTFSELLASAVQDPGTISKAYTAFHGYSIGNQLLAMFQCAARGITIGPIATFPGWKDKGRFVRKGEKAIALCMPVTCKRRAEAGAEPAEPGAEPGIYTRFVYRNNWFVMSQTDGKPFEPIAVPAWRLDRALDVLAVTLTDFAHTNGNVQGYASDRTIAISPIAAMPHKTTFHELAHVVLGHTAEAGQLSDGELTPRSLREVEAEAVAMVCCAALDLPGAAESRGYIQSWNDGSEPIPERSAQRIFKAANQILTAGRPAVAKSEAQS